MESVAIYEVSCIENGGVKTMCARQQIVEITKPICCAVPLNLAIRWIHMEGLIDWTAGGTNIT